MKQYLPVSEGKRLNICVFACISTQKTVSLHDVNNKLKEDEGLLVNKFVIFIKYKLRIMKYFLLEQNCEFPLIKYCNKLWIMI